MTQWMEQGPVLLEFDAGVATMTLNRPESSNGMNLEMMKAIHAGVMRCHREPGVRVLHLRGAGKNFCAGGDVREFSAQGAGVGDYMKEVTAWLQMAVGAMIRMDAPVVAEVQGFAAGGGGLGLVCAADIAIAGERARFLAGATRVGMAPDAGSSRILPALVGFRRAAEIFLTNRVVDAAEAERIGLVTRVTPDAALSDAARETAETLAEGAPLALSATKRLLWNSLEVEVCLPEEARTVSDLSATEDSREGLAAVIEKRRPAFKGA